MIAQKQTMLEAMRAARKSQYPSAYHHYPEWAEERERIVKKIQDLYFEHYGQAT